MNAQLNLTDESRRILKSGYLQPGEEPEDLLERLIQGTVTYYNGKVPHLEEDLRTAFFNSWLGAATPVAANFNSGTAALPISCFVVHTDDTISSIFGHLPEVAKMAQRGGGVGIGFNARARGSEIAGGGIASGPVSFMTVYDRTADEVSQGGTRRGAFSMFLDIDHPDVRDLLRSKNHAVGDHRRHIYQNIGLHVSDSFMEKIPHDKEAADLWFEILQTRIETGVPYLHFIDNHNRTRAEALVNEGMYITGTNICTEISSAATDERSMVCCLASVNLELYDDWRNWVGESGLTLPELGVYFLDAVMQEFIDKTANEPEMQRARTYAIKGRPLGLGAFGLHGFFMRRGVAFSSPVARAYNKEIFQFIGEKTRLASYKLGSILGVPVWCKSTSRRNIQTTAIAPTVSNSAICGAVSAGVTPIATNYYVSDGAKGVFKRKNKYLEECWRNSYKLSDVEVGSAWEQVLQHNGSVQGLTWMSTLDREVFRTARELDQMVIVTLAADRQPYLEQTQSINLFMDENTHPQVIHDVHMQAWRLGLPTLYYVYSDAATKQKIRSYREESVNYHVITKRGCPWCEKALAWLEERNLPFTSGDRDDSVDRVKSGVTFPQIWKNGVFIGGYDQLTGGEITGDCSACDG
jgi:ribonucleoside-diphosphate reductase alpha chain